MSRLPELPSQTPEEQASIIEVIANNPDLLQNAEKDTADVLYYLSGNEPIDQALASRWWGPQESEEEFLSIDKRHSCGHENRNTTDLGYHGRTQ